MSGEHDEALNITLQFSGLTVSVQRQSQAAASTSETGAGVGPATRSSTPCPAEPAGSASSGEPASEPSPPAGELEPPTWDERLVYAKHLGENARKALSGQRGEYPVAGRTTKLQSAHYFVLRDKHGKVYDPVFHSTRWTAIAPLVVDDDATARTGRRCFGESAVFKAWPSIQESQAYVDAAQVQWHRQ